MSETLTKSIAALLLIFMISVAYYSMLDDSAIMDEVSHLPAGYSYVSQGDMRINPEHPPLVKDLAGGAVWLASKIYNIQIAFPSSSPAWLAETRGAINSQWNFGFDFMYGQGNPADFMLFVGRLPMLFILLVLGIYIFRWTKEIFGKQAALLALFLFAFSPTFLAHGRLVTTDVAASAAVFIATYYFIHWLKKPTVWTLFFAGLWFGIAQLAKFSMFLLVLLFGFMVIAWIIHKLISNRVQAPEPLSDALYKTPGKDNKKATSFKIAWRHLGGLVFIFLFGYGFVVTPVYYFHIKNLPAEKQRQEAVCVLASYAGGPLDVKTLEQKSSEWCMQKPEIELAACKTPSRITRCPADIAVWMSDKATPLRAFGHYLLGLVMVVQRASGGNTTFFLGQISAAGWKSYFPIIYLIKEPLTLHIFTLIALITLAYYFVQKKTKKTEIPLPPSQASMLSKISGWLEKNIDAFAMLVFIALYWITSLSSNLNIGVRHILPTFPLIYTLVSGQIIYWARNKKHEPLSTFQPNSALSAQPHVLYDTRISKQTNFTPLVKKQKTYLYAKYGAISALVGWQAVSVMAVFPSFLAYFNESVGGPGQGYKYVADSNLDWGQDLVRLKSWASQQGIQRLYVDYFGGGDAKYYLGDKFQPWWGDRNPSDLKSGDWLAVSATFLQGGRGKPAPGYKDKTGYYDWLNNLQPKAVIGYSIFVYQIP
ncbi:MAG: glycosyltransferase family 39 protein [bacterium]